MTTLTLQQLDIVLATEHLDYEATYDAIHAEAGLDLDDFECVMGELLDNGVLYEASLGQFVVLPY